MKRELILYEDASDNPHCPDCKIKLKSEDSTVFYGKRGGVTTGFNTPIFSCVKCFNKYYEKIDI